MVALCNVGGAEKDCPRAAGSLSNANCGLGRASPASTPIRHGPAHGPADPNGTVWHGPAHLYGTGQHTCMAQASTP